MSRVFESSVCGLCGKVLNEQLEDIDEWHEGPFDVPNPEVPSPHDEPDHLCPECYSVIVEASLRPGIG